MSLGDFSTALWPHPVSKPSSAFNDHDTEESYLKNLKNLGEGWHYNKKPIYYQNNSLGYRTKEIEYFKDKDFILVLGCSHTEGIGQAEEEVWHSYLSKKFKLEILNAGFCASGPDMQMLNSYLFLKNSNLKPKAVVIQWPFLSRFMFKGEYLKRLLLPNFNVGLNLNLNPIFKKDKKILEKFKKEQATVESFYKTWLYDNNSVNHSYVFIESTRLMWALAGIPYYDFTLYDNDTNFNLINLKKSIKETDLARDLSHYGPKFNKKVGQIVCKELGKVL